MKLYIVRHGQTEENRQRILQGHMPGNLTEEGKKQVTTAANNLASSGVNFKVIASSDLKRAMDSALIIAEELHIPVIPMQILRERDWGNYTGMPLSEAKDKYRKGDRWEFPDGSAETEEGIYARANEALCTLQEQYPDDNVIVVTHGQFARNLIAVNFKCSYHDVAPFMNAEVRLLQRKR